MSAGVVSSEAVPVRLVEPVPVRGKREVVVSRFGRTVFNRANVGTETREILPTRATRIRALLKNRGTDSVTLGNGSDVAAFTGYRLEAADSPIEIRGAGPVWGILDPAQAGNAEIHVVEEYLIPFDEYQKVKEKKS